MRDFGVLTVELGAQSMDDGVLALVQRGHTVQNTVEAVGMLRNSGFRVGMQLMPGLPGDSPDLFRATVSKAILLQPDLVRLYPALPIQGTVLGRWYAEGLFQPLELEKAVEICAESCTRLEALGIPVIRLGLMSSPSLLRPGRIMGGPWHPAFGFLVRSRMHRKSIQSDLPRPQEASRIKIRLPQKEIPLLRGYKNRGLRWIKSRTGVEHLHIEADDSVPPGKVKIDKL
jgi:histone acetyltransferase (RNA polymerase elongator complex component)